MSRSPSKSPPLAARVKADFPNLDVLMNNAGIMLHKNLKVPAADLEGLTTEMDINQIWVTYRNLSQPANSGINATLLAAAQQSGNVIVGRKQEYCFNDDDQYDPNASPQLRDAGNGAEILRRSGRRDPAQLGAWYRAWHHDRATKLDSDSHEYELCHCEPSNRYGRTCATTTAPAHSKK